MGQCTRVSTSTTTPTVNQNVPKIPHRGLQEYHRAARVSIPSYWWLISKMLIYVIGQRWLVFECTVWRMRAPVADIIVWATLFWVTLQNISSTKQYSRLSSIYHCNHFKLWQQYCRSIWQRNALFDIIRSAEAQWNNLGSYSCQVVLVYELPWYQSLEYGLIKLFNSEFLTFKSKLVVFKTICTQLLLQYIINRREILPERNGTPSLIHSSVFSICFYKILESFTIIRLKDIL